MTEAPAPGRPIRFEYIEASGYRLVSGVTGAWGGGTPWGDVQIAFYRESLPLPEAYVVNESQGPEQPVPRHKGNEFVIERIVEFSMVLPPDTALSIGKWLTGHAEEVLRKIKQAKAGET